jgi:hypothetical protein
MPDVRFEPAAWPPSIRQRNCPCARTTAAPCQEQTWWRVEVVLPDASKAAGKGSALAQCGTRQTMEPSWFQQPERDRAARLQRTASAAVAGPAGTSATPTSTYEGL